MRVKANLHFHSAADPKHPGIRHTTREGIDRAADLGFRVLALTCHGRCLATDDLVGYARDRGMLLIPGIEADIRDAAPGARVNHVLILNCNRSAEQVRTFADLRDFRLANPGVFVIAPHPFYYGNVSLKRNLERHLDLFDAIEHCWFYSRWFDRNPRARRFALAHGLPYIATSDTHFFQFFGECYASIDVLGLSAEHVFSSLRAGNFTNVTRPRSALREMPWGFLALNIRSTTIRLRRLWSDGAARRRRLHRSGRGSPSGKACPSSAQR